MSKSGQTILVMLGGGGYVFETITLLSDLVAARPDLKFVYLNTKWGPVPPERGLSEGPVYIVPEFANMVKPQWWRNIWPMLATLLTTIFVLIRHRPNLTVVVGNRHAIPMLLASSLFFCKSVFVESITRSTMASLTLRLLHRFNLGSMWIVQWPTVKLDHKKVTVGSIQSAVSKETVSGNKA